MDCEEARLVQEEVWREYAAALEGLQKKCKVEKEEWRRKLDAEQLEINEWTRWFHVGNDKVNRKYDAEKEELDKKRKANHKEYIERTTG